MDINARRIWLENMLRIAGPVLENLANRTLKANMPVKGKVDRTDVAHLEALGRLLCGMAPWLESDPQSKEEDSLRKRYANLARASIASAVDPGSPDYMNFSEGTQPLVDAAFLAQAIIRAPSELWFKLNTQVQENLIRELRRTRSIKPHFNNWLLFSATVEAALFSMGFEYDSMRIDYALKQHEQWYMGDGIYSDGPRFRWDYYNSFVIQPMLVDIISLVSSKYYDWEKFKGPVLKRAQRYSCILERLISPEGTFPPIGRSLAYRMGSFHLLAQMAYLEKLPNELSPAQVRCALSRVIKRTMNMPGTFDKDGWLNIGFAGYQPDVGEDYICTGSLYLCAAVFLPLGLNESSRFWSLPDEKWTSKSIWHGMDMSIDHSIY